MKDENEKVYFHLKRNFFKWKDFKFHYEIALEEDLDEHYFAKYYSCSQLF